MHHYIRPLALCILTITSFILPAHASHIATTVCLREIAGHVTENSIVVLDLDNTVMVACKLDGGHSVVGTDQMFSHMFAKAMHLHGDARAAIEHVLPTYFAAQRMHDCVLTQDDAVEIVKELQKRCPVIGLTARSTHIMDRTAEQLNALDIDLTRGHLPSEPLDLTLDDKGIYHHGIIFGANNDKGKILLHCLKQLDHSPEKIIFVDDKEKNIKSVERAAQQAGIEFIGLHYTRCDGDVSAFAEDAPLHEEAWHRFETENEDMVQYFKERIKAS